MPELAGVDILAVVSRQARDPEHYRRLLTCFPTLSHVTVEVRPR